MAALVDFRLRGRGSDAAFVYEPEIVEPRLVAAVRDIDLVIAGPPCQGHSNLNNQTRRDDVRNALYLTVPAFAVAASARMAIIENVPEVTSARSCREAARLQGFPDSYRFVTDPRHPPSRAKLAKWIGDAVPMPLGYAAALSAVGGDATPFLE